MKTTRRFPGPPPAARQRGVVLMITLVVLAALMLAAVALMRSVDTGNLLAGNLAFRSSTLNTSDRGIETAYRWIVTNAGTTLEANQTASAYWAAAPATEPDWTGSGAWTDAICLDSCAADATGNRVRYVIHRMCTAAGAISATNACATITGDSGNSSRAGAMGFQPPPLIYYRVTVRVEGPRNSASVVQAMIVGS